MNIQEKISHQIPIIAIDNRSIFDRHINKRNVAVMAAILFVVETVLYFFMKFGIFN